MFHREDFFYSLKNLWCNWIVLLHMFLHANMHLYFYDHKILFPDSEKESDLNSLGSRLKSFFYAKSANILLIL